nr:RNA-directed DNA polymerase, eukaryota [Tanacetum cinerariifolium]
VYLDRLPTRLNLLHRGVHVPSLSCPIYSSALEDTSHLLFSCGMASDVVRLVCRWNQLLFATQKPRKDVSFDDIVVRSFSWCIARCKSTLTWDSWLQHPSLISL